MSPRARAAWLALGLLLPAAEAAAQVPEARPPTVYDAPLVWHDESGRETRLSRFRGEPVYLTLFYTTCRSHICREAIDSLREIDLGLRDGDQSAHFVLISLDPERDTPAVLERYKHGYELGDNWHLPVGDRRQTDWLAHMLQYAYYKKGFHYLHSYAIYVLDRRGVIVDVLGWDSKDGHGAPG